MGVMGGTMGATTPRSETSRPCPVARLRGVVGPHVEDPRVAPRSGPVEEVEGDRGEERRDAQVVVGQAGQDRQRVPALRPALAHPAAVTETAVEKLEGLDVVA